MTDYERIEKVIRHLDARHREQPGLEELARVAGLSPFHFHRLFSRWAGLTPKAFLKALTANHAKRLLLQSGDLLGVSLDTGLSGPGRLHDLLVSVEGVTPGEFKGRGAGLDLIYGFQDSPFGPCLVGITPRGICHMAFVQGPGKRAALQELRARWPVARVRLDPDASARAVRSLFAPKRGSRLSAVVRGTPFQIKVWEALLRIPSGRVSSYGRVAADIGRAGAARAVGSAVGQNPVAYLIPCHRVILETGAVGEYHWGSIRKKAMLAREGAVRT
jgi:AraC family transcriptional regulator of adaptative response/methylated-DNA-[protein]-cysteine methyltransferase